jgi:hypothetical protein
MTNLEWACVAHNRSSPVNLRSNSASPLDLAFEDRRWRMV